MKTKTINLYKFEELTAEQQEKVLDKYRDWNDDVFESYAEDECNTLEITENGFNNPTIHYDLSCSQGSGACFDCTEFDFDKLLKDWEHPHKKWFINIIQDYCEYGIFTNQFGYHYSHANTRDFNICYRYDHKHIEKTLCEIVEYIEALRLELSENLTARLYEQLEWLRDDERIKETLISNEYYFNAETLEIEY